MALDESYNSSTVRRRILDMAYRGKSVHVACAFSLVEILAVLYRNHLKLGVRSDEPSRDYLVLSKGHGVMALYACLFERGWITQKQLDDYFKDGSDLKGLSDARVPGVEATTGSLGHGLPVAAGLALGAVLKRSGQRVYCIVGDGEMNEGSNWEAMLFAKQQRLGNLTVIVDQNGFQALGPTQEVMDLGDLGAKFRAFGFETLDVDGHDEKALDIALKQLRVGSSKDQPKALIARTVKGKGVSFMEHDNVWHYTRLTDETYKSACEEVGRSS